MKLISRVIAAAVAALILGFASPAVGSESSPPPGNEQAVIEALIVRLESLTDAQFVRNGKAYPPSTAGKFLRAKWKDRASRIKTAEDFIETIASRSSTTGRPYLVRRADGSEMPTRSVLYLELQRIRGGK